MKQEGNRGELLSCGFVEVLHHLGEDVVDGALGFDSNQFALLLVVVDDGSRGIVEGVQTLLDRLNVVVGAPAERVRML